MYVNTAIIYKIYTNQIIFWVIYDSDKKEKF